MIMSEVVDPPLTEFWDDSDVSQRILDYYRQRPKLYFSNSSPKIQSRVWYMMKPDRFNSYQYSPRNYKRPNVDDFHFQPVSTIKNKFIVCIGKKC